MTFGIIGCGMIARFHARAIKEMEGCRLVAAFDHSSERATAFANEHEIDGFADLGAMLAREDLETVIVATPSGAHLEPVLAAAQAGKHVVCEKPLEVTLERIDQMTKACEEAGVVLGGIFDRRFNPGVRMMQKALREGRFGRVVSVSASIKWWREQAYYDQASWRGTWALDGGGALMNQSVHTLDKLLLFGGPVDSVSGRVRTLTHERIEVEDNAVAHLEFASGALGVIEASTSCWSVGGHPGTVMVCGTKGSAALADERFSVWEFASESEDDATVRSEMMASQSVALGANDPAAIGHGGHRRNLEDFVSAVRQGRRPEVSAVEGRQTVALVRAIYESSAAGSALIPVSPLRR